MKTQPFPQPTRLEEIFTLLIGLLTLAAAGAGVFIPGFYDGIVDPTMPPEPSPPMSFR
jgi:hypothetical protein